MKCPYCEKEMTSGLIYSREVLYFQEDNAPKRFGIFPKKLKIQSCFDMGLQSQYCKDCNKVIMDLKE